MIQGGYFPTVFLLVGIILAVATLLSGKRAITGCEWILWAVSVLYLIASVAKGYSAETLAQACLPGVCALYFSLYRSLPEEKRIRFLDGMVIGTGIFAGMAILAFCGVLSLLGAVTARRLQFTFQYANAAGVWFAALALLAQDNENNKLRRWTAPCLTALLLTRSVGALGVYALVQLIRLWLQRKDRCRWQETILIHSMATVFAVGFYFLSGWTTLPLMALLYIASWNQEKIGAVANRLRLHWFCLVGGICGIIAVTFSVRVFASVGTFAERLCQIWDGWNLITQYPLLGVGAGNWRWIHPYYQSAQYTSTVIHSGFTQIGVDAGLPAVVAVAVCMILALREKGRKPVHDLAFALIAVHSMVDFTLQFFPITALALTLLAGKGSSAKPETRNTAVSAVAAVSFGILCSVMLYSELQHKTLIAYTNSGAWQLVIENYEQQRWFFGDSRTARESYVRALYGTGNLQGVVRTTDGDLSRSELLLRAKAVQLLGDQHNACRIILEELARQKHNVTLFKETAALLVQWGVDEQLIARYNQLADQSNASHTILGTLMGNQVKIDHIL